MQHRLGGLVDLVVVAATLRPVCTEEFRRVYSPAFYRILCEHLVPWDCVPDTVLTPSPCMQAVVDRPDETRRVIPFKRLILTDFKCDLTRLAKKKELQQALDESGMQQVMGKFLRSATCRGSTCILSRKVDNRHAYRAMLSWSVNGVHHSLD